MKQAIVQNIARQVNDFSTCHPVDDVDFNCLDDALSTYQNNYTEYAKSRLQAVYTQFCDKYGLTKDIRLYQ